MHGQRNLHIKLHAHGRIKLYRRLHAAVRPQVVHPWLSRYWRGTNTETTHQWLYCSRTFSCRSVTWCEKTDICKKKQTIEV